MYYIKYVMPSPRAQCRVLPPGESNSMISEPFTTISVVRQSC